MKRAFTLVESLAFVGFVAILAAILWPVFNRPHETNCGSSCQSHLKNIGIGFMQYMEDAGEKFPPVYSTSSVGWADVLQPYINSSQLFQCPNLPTASSDFSSDYFYNRRLALLSLDKLESSTQTILSGDGADNAPTWNSISHLPSNWTAANKSPSLRHRDGANYLFADGHVKSLKRTQITNAFSKMGTATFAVR